MIEGIIEIIIYIFGEIFLQIIAEILFELGFHSMANMVKQRKQRNPIWAFIGYCLLGAIVGAISLWIFPALFISGKYLAITNLILTPILAGFVMSAIGKWRSKRGKDLIRLDTFLYGFAFAFCMALIRFLFSEIGTN